MTAVQIKDTALGSAERYVRERFGEEAWRQVLDALAPDDRRRIENGILVSAWYPFALFMGIVRVLERQLGAQVPRLHREMGRAAADYGLTTFYKVFFKVGSPQFIISRVAKVWRTYNSSGELTAPVSEKGHAVVELADCRRAGARAVRTPARVLRAHRRAVGRPRRQARPLALREPRGAGLPVRSVVEIVGSPRARLLPGPGLTAPGGLVAGSSCPCRPRSASARRRRGAGPARTCRSPRRLSSGRTRR